MVHHKKTKLKNTTNKEDVLLVQIKQLLERGLFFAEYSKKYKELYNKKKNSLNTNELTMSPPRWVFVIMHLLFIQESFLVLASLFSKDKREASFNTLLKGKQGTEEYIAFNKIRDDYMKTIIPILRDKLIAHKDTKNIGSPIAGFVSPYSDSLIDEAITFYNRLKDLLHEYFVARSTNDFESGYQKHFDYLYDKLKDDEN